MSEKLKRNLGVIDIFAIAAGAMISSGLFLLPSIAYQKAGAGIILSYFLAGLFMLPALFSQIELATAMPKAGGSYFFIERALGPLAGTMTGLANWLSISLKSAFALIGIGTFVSIFFPHYSYNEIRIVAVIFCWLFTIINIISLKTAGRIQVILVFLLIIILGSYVITGINKVNMNNYIPFIKNGLRSIFATAGMVFISYGGLTKVASIGEEVKNPGKTIPVGIISAFIVVELLYISVISVTIGVVPGSQLMKTLLPISEGGRIISGITGYILISISAIIAYLTTANAGIMSASRSPMAMSIDGLLPEFFGKLSKKFFTPYISIIITSIFMSLTILILNLENLVKFASTLMILLFILTNFAVIIMRESKIKSYRPKFKSPLYPVLQITGIVIYIFLIAEMGKTPLLITAGFIITSLGWYFIYVKPRIQAKQYALLYIVARVLPADMETPSIEEELRDIIIERDNIQEDRFDQLVKQCKIIDINKKLLMKEFFKIISDVISNETGIEKKKLYKLFIKREKESTTVIHPGFAIPHIILPGKSRFIIIPVRCKEGIQFESTEIPVHTAFVLAGTKDERNFHLKALMAIAQIMQSENFEKLWLEARNVRELRNIILLATRKRTQL